MPPAPRCAGRGGDCAAYRDPVFQVIGPTQADQVDVVRFGAEGDSATLRVLTLETVALLDFGKTALFRELYFLDEPSGRFGELWWCLVQGG